MSAAILDSQITLPTNRKMSMINLEYATESRNSGPKLPKNSSGTGNAFSSFFSSTKTLITELEEEHQEKEIPRWQKITTASSSRPTRSVFYRQQLYLYNFILRPRGFLAFAYHCTVAMIILLELLFFALSTVRGEGRLQGRSLDALRALLIAILTVQTVEFLLLIWASSCLGRYRGCRGKLRFLVAPFRLFNALFIGITAVMVWTCWFTPEEFGRYEWLRLGIIFQVLRLENRFKPWRFFRSVLWIERQHLLAASFVIFLVFITLAYVEYFIEHQEPETGFTNIPNAAYYAVVTMMGIGYGDIVPLTTAGRAVLGFFALFACVAFNIPSGILSTGLALRTYERNRRKQKSKRTIPAARLIQTAWRVRATRKMLSKISSEENDVRFRRLQIALLFVAKLKFDVARRKFKDVNRPLDLKDVMQQYSEGHAGVVEQVKATQLELNTAHYGLDGTLGLVEEMAARQADRVRRVEEMVEVIAQLMRKRRERRNMMLNRRDQNSMKSEGN